MRSDSKECASGSESLPFGSQHPSTVALWDGPCEFARCRPFQAGFSRVQNEGMALKRNLIFSSLLFLLVLAATGCKQKAAPAAAAGMQALPVQTVAVSMSPVPDGSDYTATIKSRRSATLQPQVNGRLTGISVRSGELV